MKNTEGLKEDIRSYDRLIKRGKGDDKTYYGKAEALAKLAEAETAEAKSDYQQQAIDAYSKAIDLSGGKNPLYLIDRSKLYAQMGKTDLAVGDIRQVEQLPKADGISGLYITTVVRDISRLDSVQETIAQLVKNKAIDPRLASALKEHAKVTAGLVVQVGAHGEALEKHDGRIEKLERMVQQLLRGQKLSEEQIVEIERKLDAVELKAQEHQDRLDEHHDVLQNSGTYNKAAIKRGFEELEQKNPQLYAYCKTFYWTTLNLFAACKVLSSGMIKGDIDYNQSTTDQLLEVGVKKAIGYGAELTKSIPFVGGVIGLLDSVKDDIYDKVKENGLENKINSINKIIQTKFKSDEEISMAIGKAALNITGAKAQEILSPKQETPSKLQSKMQWVQEKFEAVKDKILPSVELHDKDDYAAQLALKDVAALMAYLWKNHEAIVKDDRPLDEEFAAIIVAGELGQNGKELSAANDQQVHMLNEIIYDNELLNHPELLQAALKQFTLDQILNLSSGLDNSVVEDAINSDDSDIVLAGLLSLGVIN